MSRIPQNIDTHIYRPMFTTFGTINDDNSFTNLWGFFDTLPDAIKDILMSDEIADELYTLQQGIQLVDKEMSGVTWLAREIFFRRIPESKIEENLQKIGIDQAKISSVASYLRDKVLNIKIERKTRQQEVQSGEKLAILQALDKFPTINDQQITSERIRVRSEREPVRGTVRNWLRAYRDALGVRKHSSVERGQFVFQSENARKLPSEEKERVALVLKSLDELFPLSIDPEKKIILFPEYNPSQEIASNANVAPGVAQFSKDKAPQGLPIQQASFSGSAQLPKVAAPNKPMSSQALSSKNITPAQQEPLSDDVSDEVLFKRMANLKSVHNFSTSKKAPESTGPSSLNAENNGPSVSFAKPKPHDIASQKTDHDQSFQFSSGQVLPVEKVIPENAPSSKNAFIPGTPLPKLPKNQSPQAAGNNQKREIWQVPDTIKNMVDLRSEE